MEYCEPKNCFNRENYYFSLIKPEYNILKTAGSSLGFKHSEEAKKLMAMLRKGKFHSSETKTKIGAASLGRKLPQQALDKLSIAHKGRARPAGSGKPSQRVEVLDILTNKRMEFDSIREAARALDIKPNTIMMYFKRNSKSVLKRYIIKKI